MKKHVILLAVLGMVVLMAAAVAWDCVRMAAVARRRVAVADEELQKHEQRLVKLLNGSPQLSPEVRSAIATYEGVVDRPARHDAYDGLVASFRQTMSAEVDSTNPLDRKFMDDIAGSINRRDIAEKQYDLESTAYQNALNGFRGNVARMLSSQARADWKSGE